MSDESPLREFVVSFGWIAPRNIEICRIIARSSEDAMEIARRLFEQSHTEDCVISSMSATR